MHEKACSEMGQYEVPDHLRNADQSENIKINSLSNYWRRNNRNLTVRCTVLYTIGDEVIKSEDAKVEDPDTLVLYIMHVGIVVKS